jgi:DNA-directed RNA polymerase specialized sigma24 family protein
MSEKILNSIDNRLRIMSKLLALDVVKGRPFQEQIKILHELGMQPMEIADCLGKTSNNVRVAIHSIKKKSKGEKKDE